MIMFHHWVPFLGLATALVAAAQGQVDLEGEWYATHFKAAQQRLPTSWVSPTCRTRARFGFCRPLGPCVIQLRDILGISNDSAVSEL